MLSKAYTHTVPKIVGIFAFFKSLPRLELMQRYVSGFLARYMKTKPGSSRDGLGFYADIQNQFGTVYILPYYIHKFKFRYKFKEKC